LEYWLKLLILASIVFSCSLKQEETKAPVLVIPSDWKPSLEQVQDDLKEALDRNPNKSQQVLNRAAQNMADLADARLFIVYVRLMETLDSAARVKLFNEQKDWLVHRADAAQAGVTSKGGSLGPLEYNGVYRKITEERLVELEKRLAK